jgi:hypothetical protein
MRGKFAPFMVVLAAGGIPWSTSAVSAPGQQTQHHCRVIGGDKLPADSGGADAVCSAIQRAVAERSPAVNFSAEVKVVTPSMLTANLTVNGRTLPEQKFAIMDRELNRGAIERFAQSLAMEVAKAAEA